VLKIAVEDIPVKTGSSSIPLITFLFHATDPPPKTSLIDPSQMYGASL
jgi:hypothetical protein